MRVVWSVALCILGFPYTSLAGPACRAERNGSAGGSAFLGELIFTTKAGVSAFEEAVGRRPVPLADARVQSLRAKLGVEGFSRIDAATLCSYVNDGEEREKRILAATDRSVVEELAQRIYLEAEKLDPLGIQARVEMI